MTTLLAVQLQKVKLAGSGCTSSATSIILQSLKYLDGTDVVTADFGDKGFATIEPGTSKEEQISFTGVTQNADETATLTGVTRGLAFNSPYAETAGNKMSHAGGSILVISNTAGFYGNIKDYADGLTIGGAPDATTTLKGIAKASVAPASASSPIFVGDNDPRVPTADENNALAGSAGTPNATNKYVTEDAIASETAKGIVEEATDAQVTAGTATGETSAKLFVTPAKLATRLTNYTNTARATSIIPKPDFWFTGAQSGFNFNTNTVMYSSRMVIPLTIVVNKISIYATAAGTAGTLKLTLFSEDGQTQLFSVTTASISGAGIVTTAVSAVTVPAGIYYISIVSVSTAAITVSTWASEYAGTPVTFLNGVTSEPVYIGKETVTASTVPATITPASLTSETTNPTTVTVRLDT